MTSDSSSGVMYSRFKTVLLLFVALSAVRWDIFVMDSLDEGSQESTKALQLTALAIVEDMESHYATAEAVRDENQAEMLDSKAHQYLYKSKVDQVYATRESKRGEYMAQVAEKEQEKADAMFLKANRDEQLYEEILKNMTYDEEKEKEIVEELRQIHSGACEGFLSRLCDLVGGTIDLLRDADEEYVKIQQEWQEKEKVGRREYMEELVAKTLQGKATQYNKTAEALFKAADYYEEQAREDYLRGVAYSNTATSAHSAADRLKKQGEDEIKWEDSNLSLAEQKWAASENLYKRAIRGAVIASFLATTVLVFFLIRTVMKSMTLLISVLDWSKEDRTPEKEFWRCVSYSVLHVIIFFASVGLVGNFLPFLDRYDWRQRAAIISWFAFLAALIQTLFLHTVPHVMAEWPVNRSDCCNIAKHSGFRFLSLFLLFVLELLFMSVNFGKWILSTQVVAFVGSPLVDLVGLGLLALYVYFFEPRSPSPSPEDNHSQATLPADDDDDTETHPSEITPLTGEDWTKTSSSTGVTAMALLTMDLGPAGRGDTTDVHSHYSLDALSPYFVNLRYELQKLVLPFEMLVISCMIAVLVDCLPLACHSLLAEVALICYFSLLTMTAVWRQACLAGSTTTLRKRNPVSSLPHIEIVNV